MVRYLVPSLLVALALAACTPATDTETEQPSSTSTAPEPSIGRFATTSVAGIVRIHASIDSDPILVVPSDGEQFQQPTWTSDGNVLVSVGSEAGNSGLVLLDGMSGDEIWRVPLTSPPFYTSPGPPGSFALSTSLRSGPGGAGLIAELIRPNGDVEELSTDSPFYTAWSPTGEALATHSGGQLVTVLNDESITELSTTSGAYQAPAWTEAGLVFGDSSTGRQTIRILTDDGVEDLAEVQGGPFRFVAAGRTVAALSLGSDEGGIEASLRTQAAPRLRAGWLTLVDISTQDLTTISEEPSAFFQLDPSGELLVFMTVTDASAGLLAWHLWDGSTTSRLGEFVANPNWIRTIVPFFDQYAQSAPVWDPSSAFIGYPAVDEGEPVVVVHPLAGEPVKIRDSTWIAWAP